MKKVLVIGATGLIGSRFIELAKNKLDIIAVDEKSLDIIDKNAVDNYFNDHQFDSVLNFAAFTNVDEAEKQRGGENGLAWKLNFEGPKNLAIACKKGDIFLIQISTDFVFNGSEDDPGPYTEDRELSSTNDGISWYGWSKNRAEDMLKNSGVKHAIVRIAYPFYKAEYHAKLDFAKSFLKLFDEKKLYPIFSDQTLSVLNVDELITPLTKIINEEIKGIFHLVASDITTPFDFASYLLEKTRGAKDVLQKGSMKEFLKADGRTPRPRLGGLKTKITENKLDIKFKTWKEMINLFVESL